MFHLYLWSEIRQRPQWRKRTKEGERDGRKERRLFLMTLGPGHGILFLCQEFIESDYNLCLCV